MKCKQKMCYLDIINALFPVDWIVTDDADDDNE